MASWLGSDGQQRDRVPRQCLTQLLVPEEHLAVVHLPLPQVQVSLQVQAQVNKTLCKVSGFVAEAREMQITREVTGSEKYANTNMVPIMHAVMLT